MVMSTEAGGPAAMTRSIRSGTSTWRPAESTTSLPAVAGKKARVASMPAQASRIEVEVRYDRRQLRVRVLDNGKGIDAKVLDEGGRSGHFGLPGMHERAKSIGGNLTVRRRTDAGTEAELTIPRSVAYAKGASQ